MIIHLQRIKHNFFYIVLFATIAILGGWIPPYIYYKYINKTQYFTYDSVTTDKTEYKACDPITLHVKRKALIETRGRLSVTLYKRNDGGIAYQHTQLDVPITSGPREFDDATFAIPCEGIIPGEYWYRGVLIYHVDRVEQSVNFDTNYFKVN